MKQYVAPRAALFGLTLTAVAALVTGCGGGSGTPVATVSLAGVVADGYLAGAKVCLDKNENMVCDAGEASATTGTNGAYTITGVTAADAAAYPVIAEVPATAVDSDSPGTTVGKAFVLSAPKGNTTVTPLSSLVHQEMAATPALSAASAAANVKAALSITSNPLADYIANPDADAHVKAQMIAESLKNNMDAIGGGTTAQKKDLQSVLLTMAKQSTVAAAPASGASAPATVPVVGVEDFNTVRAVLAHKLTTGTASQAVTVNFDVLNGTTSVKACDSVTLTGLTQWDQAPLTATPPAAATALATANQTPQTVAGKMVDIRFYISNVLLWDAAGNAVPLQMTEGPSQSKNVALLDFGRTVATTPSLTCSTVYNTSISGFAVAGTYTGISFTLGVPVRSADLSSKLNHGAKTPATAASAAVAQPAPVAVLDESVTGSTQAGMLWSWQSGRRFAKIEFQPTVAIKKFSSGVVATNAIWNVHLGSTGCSGNPLNGNETACTNSNRVGVKLPSFNAATEVVKLDLDALFVNSDLTYEGGGAGGCMSGTTDPECPGIFKSLGLSLTNGQTLTGNAIQTVFKK